MTCVDIALQPIVRCAVAVALHRLPIPHTDTIELCSLEQKFPNSVNLGAMGIFFGLHLGVMLSMHGNPTPD